MKLASFVLQHKWKVGASGSYLLTKNGQKVLDLDGNFAALVHGCHPNMSNNAAVPFNITQGEKDGGYLSKFS